jgi:hypothetical protein
MISDRAAAFRLYDEENALPGTDPARKWTRTDEIPATSRQLESLYDQAVWLAGKARQRRVTLARMTRVKRIARLKWAIGKTANPLELDVVAGWARKLDLWNALADVVKAQDRTIAKRIKKGVDMYHENGSAYNVWNLSFYRELHGRGFREVSNAKL